MARGSGPPYPPPQHLINLLNEAAKARLGIPGLFTLQGDQIVVSGNYATFVGTAVNINLANMVMKTVATSAKGLLDYVELIGRAIALEQSPEAKHLEKANKQLAAHMRNALRERYGSSVENRKQVPSYVRANRLSGNLRRAITQPDMAVGTANEIKYINQDRLNSEARHWARINFGVRGAPGAKGGARTKAPEQFELLGSGEGSRNIGSIGFKIGPRDPMYLPPGFWMFIGGRAPGATTRVGNVPTVESDDYEDNNDVVARRMAARRVKRGNASGDDFIRSLKKMPKRAPGVGGSMRDLRLNKQSGTSSWGADVGGYPRASSYKRKKQFKLEGKTIENPAWEKRRVSRVIRGVRSSRQGFYPTRSNKRYPTRGVVGAQFMDAGFRALRDNLDLVYAQMANDMIQDATNKSEKKAINKLRVQYNALMEIDRLLAGGGMRLRGSIEDIGKDKDIDD